MEWCSNNSLLLLIVMQQLMLALHSALSAGFMVPDLDRLTPSGSTIQHHFRGMVVFSSSSAVANIYIVSSHTTKQTRNSMQFLKLEPQKSPRYICALAEGTCQADICRQAVQVGLPPTVRTICLELSLCFGDVQWPGRHLLADCAGNATSDCQDDVTGVELVNHALVCL